MYRFLIVASLLTLLESDLELIDPDKSKLESGKRKKALYRFEYTRVVLFIRAIFQNKNHMIPWIGCVRVFQWTVWSGVQVDWVGLDISMDCML